MLWTLSVYLYGFSMLFCLPVPQPACLFASQPASQSLGVHFVHVRAHAFPTDTGTADISIKQFGVLKSVSKARCRTFSYCTWLLSKAFIVVLPSCCFLKRGTEERKSTVLSNASLSCQRRDLLQVPSNPLSSFSCTKAPASP